MYKKVLITGGAGFIGSNLALALINMDYEITVLDNLSSQVHGDNPDIYSPLYISMKDKVNFINGTVTAKEDWLKAIAENEVIVHLAAETGTGQSMYQVEKYTAVNIGGTALMLDILANTNTNVKKVVIASSRAIYGEGKYLNEHGVSVYPTERKIENLQRQIFEPTNDSNEEKLTLVATDENSKIHPTSVYGITKQNQEQMVMTVCNSLNIAAVAFRYQNVYGPGQSLANPYTGILSIFSTQIKNNKGINIFEDGKESRDFVYIDDVVNATILGIEKDTANGQVFNVGTGVATTVMEVANSLIENYKIDVPLTITGNFRIGDIRHNYADISKIKNLLGFEPLVSFKDGISKFTAWVNEQSVVESKYENSLTEMKEKGLMK
jgi:dTDP-L-rhamnose 4-epimerase